MKKPGSVVVMGTSYKIEYCPDAVMKNLCGDVNFEDKIIRLRDSQSELEGQATLLHEIIHIVLERSGMTFLISSKMDEALTRALENGLAPLVTLNLFKRGRST